MPQFIDQTGRTIFVNAHPHRIISLVPSQTELLFDLGLTDEVVGITKFCIHPTTWFQTKTRVGGTKQVKGAIIAELQPDLIIANKEENVKVQVEELARQFPVWISDINNLTDAYWMIDELGKITERASKAADLIAQIKNSFSGLVAENPVKKVPAAYLIWQHPYMTVGGDTFIHSMMEAAGFENVFSDRKRYPEVSLDEIRETGCQVLLLSSEPFPFKEHHATELRPLLPDTQVVLADGEMFSWYGSRLRRAPAYFRKLRDVIHQRL